MTLPPDGWILTLADDLTGALEAAAKFAARGLTSTVNTERSILERPRVQVLVVDTETRHLSALEAAVVIRTIAGEARRFAPSLIFKKTDSTLRGNIAAELGALRDVWPEKPIVFAAAYPAMGRTVRGGRLFVNGIPVHESAFASDRLNPVRGNDLRQLLGELTAIVPDCETDGELLAIARSIMSMGPLPLTAGPAALADVLARCISVPRIERCLVVNGSRHAVSAAQIEFAKSSGCFQDGWVLFDEEAAGEGMEHAMEAGERVRSVLSSGAFDALIVFGGDTAYGIHRALGSLPFEPLGEVLPGVPLSMSAGLLWITKAGGFGPPDTLCNIKSQLR